VSLYGKVVTNWNRAQVSLPANTKAIVILPDGKTQEIGSGAHSYAIR
jgi:alpha-L-rhamnosidase